MKFIADFHIHSHYSIATSKNLIPEYLEYWARLKGIDVLGTGDCIHPGWLNELKEKLEPADNGMYRLKDEYRLDESKFLSGRNMPADVNFILTGEISNIYKKNERVRKVHNLCVFPDFDAVHKVQLKLDKMGNISSDGRPILGLDSKILLEMVLESSDLSYLIPAHIWTPWFSVLGSKSGFDSIEECYNDLTGHIFAVETGLSSDPAMNWTCSFLDRFKLVSNSDAHSPEKLGREANLFDTDMSFDAIYSALKGDKGFLGTIEFFPEEGKYHYDGHRKCNIRWNPLETIKQNGICPVCGKGVTKGVMYRISELADRQDIETAGNGTDFYSITQLPDIIAEILGRKSSKARSVTKEFHRLVENLGSEFHILLDAEIDEIESIGGDILAEGIKRLRNNDVIIEEGFDGEFGRIRVFKEDELHSFSGNNLFDTAKSSLKEKEKEKEKENRRKETKLSLKFDIGEFQQLKKKNPEFSEVHEDKRIGAQDILQRVSKEQKAGIEHFERPCIVLAGPGTGKTAILTERIVKLVNERKISPENILAVTFSNKAAEEMRSRIKGRIKLPGVNISTFHAFGLSILKEYYDKFGRENDFSIIDDEEKFEIINGIIKNKRKANKAIKEIELFKQGIEKDYKVGDITDIIKEYDRELQSKNAFDLNDLIYLPVELFRLNPEILALFRKKFSWILVDEFQDINSKQYEFITLLAGRNSPNLFLIGDPDQAIYGFRGADARFIKRIEEDYPDIEILHLSKSYRCPDIVLKVGGQVLGREKFLSGKAIDMKVNIQEMATERSEADWIASMIERIIGGVRSFSIDSGISNGEALEDNVSFSDFAVLCRTASMFEAFITAFNNHGISYAIISSKTVYQKEPYRSVIRSLKKIFYDRYDGSLSEEIANDVSGMIKKGDAVTDVLKFMMIIDEASDDEISKIKSIADIFGNSYNEFFRSVATREGIDDRDDKMEAVSLMTIHASKGLEFNTVFIPGCEEGIIPFDIFGKIGPDELDEEERLFYVGVTRTVKNLYLTNARSRNFKGRILKNRRSRFIDRLEDELLIQGKRKGRKRDRIDDTQLDLFSIDQIF